MKSYDQWKMGVLFATYTWNASPIDSLDVIRSFAAKARTFKFPLDTHLEGETSQIPQEGKDNVAHVETMFSSWFQVISDERRARHQEMMNSTRKHQKFQPGELVIIRKQVAAKEGQPGKLT